MHNAYHGQYHFNSCYSHLGEVKEFGKFSGNWKLLTFVGFSFLVWKKMKSKSKIPIRNFGVEETGVGDEISVLFVLRVWVLTQMHQLGPSD